MAYDTRELAVQITGDASSFNAATASVGTASGKATDSLSQFSDASKKASVVLAGVGVGLTAYAKSATDYTTQLYTSSKQLALVTGDTIEQSSGLLYAAERMNLSADQATQTFGIFSKQIQSATTDAKNSQAAQRDLQTQIDQTKLSLQKNNDELAKNQEALASNAAQIAKNGDKTGQLATAAKLLNDQQQSLTLNSQSLNNKLSDLNTQMNTSTNTFQKLGVSVVDAQGNTRSFDDILLDVADKFKAMPDGVQKTTDAMDLFGRSGKDLIPLLDQGSAGITNLESEANKLGLTLTAQSVSSIAKYIQAQKNLKDSTNALKLQVGLLTTPVLTNFDNKVNGLTKSLLSMHGPMHTLTVDTLAFGGPVAGAASGMAAFLGNISSAGPALRGFTALMGNPYILAALGVVAATGGIIYEYEKLRTTLGSTGSAFDTAQDKLTGANAKYASGVTFLQLAQDDQKRAEDAVTLAIQQHNNALAAIAPSQDIAKQKADAITLAQQGVQTALQQFGTNSPQYLLATENLSNAEYLYNQQLLNNWGLEVNVKTSADNLAGARTQLATATDDLNRVQGILNNGLDSGNTIIAKYGPTALAQVAAIDTLQNHLSIVVSTFNGFTANIQAQVPNINQQLGGISNAIQIYQGQSANLNAALSGAASSSSKLLQNAGAILQAGHNASGTDSWSGGLTWVGENGPELINAPRGSQIIPADKSKQLASASQTPQSPSVNVTVNVGMYAGMAVEKRQIALDLYKELVRAARSQGVSMPMIGAVGVQ